MKNISFILSLMTLFLLNTASLSATCEYGEGLQVEDFAMGNLLKWTTTKEVNHKQFAIEKSNDGITFENIGTVAAQGGSAQTEYSFLDVSASQGRSYYRLREMGTEGSVSFSKIAIANMSLQNNFTVVSLSPPNADGKLEMVVNSKKVNLVEYEIRDLENNVYYTAKQQLNNGINIISIDIVNELLKDGRVFRIALKGEAENEILTFKSDGY